MRLLLDNGIFYEFVPVDELDSPDPTRHWIGNVRKGVDYAVVLSSCAGVWGYVIGDTVRFVDVEKPRVLITGRTSYVLSAFGEHVIDTEIEESITAAADAIDARVTEYSVAAKFPETPGERGGHLYVVEFADPQPDDAQITKFRDVLDQGICELNADYEAFRAGGGVSVRAPEIAPVPPGTFMAWMKKRGQLGGQHKVPRIIADQELAQGLWEFCGL